MGRKADMRPRFGRMTYEAKLRKPGDRVDGNGSRQEGGKIFSRHFEANNTDHAQRVAQRLANKFNSRVVSITKVHPEDIIGDYRTWNLRDIIGKPVPERRRDVILDDATLDEIVFNKRK
jgi:hypothetical protein